jgi:hypothetical protein
VAEPSEPSKFEAVSRDAEQIVATGITAIPSPDLEKISLDAAQKKEITEAVHAHLGNVDFAKNIKARETLAGRLFWLTLSWVVAIFIVILLQGFCRSFNLHDNVMIAFIGGTTANVIGLLAVVVRYFFSRPN